MRRREKGTLREDKAVAHATGWSLQVALPGRGRRTMLTRPISTAQTVKPGARAWVVLGMLCFVYVLNFLDRQLLSILAKPIQDSLHVSDGQLGLIGGLYFALFYCFISIPVGWIADKTNRVSGSVARLRHLERARRWPAALAANYPQLVAARMTVGFGEAGGVPPSYAIISDYFPPGRRGTALGIYNLGPPIGAALGVAFGASIAAAYSWRYAFIVLGAVGLFAAMLILVSSCASRCAAASTGRQWTRRPTGSDRLLADDRDVLLAARAGACRAWKRRHAVHHLWRRAISPRSSSCAKKA